MGLCKCPQRKVTNIFCFSHRVNVCEHCLMQNHSKCVVDTYRNWITDSLFSANCGLCDHELIGGETVRLLCLHIVHWNCLDAWARSLPPTTAPAGYTCPICRKMSIFPAHNQISPIAEELKRKMASVNWARAGLGLSLLDNDPPPPPTGILLNGVANNWSPMANGSDYHEMDKRAENEQSYHGHHQQGAVAHMGNGGNNMAHNNSHNNHEASTSSSASAMLNHSYSKLSDNFGSPNSKPYFPDPTVTTTRKSVKFDPEIPLLLDEEDKYRRRSPFESLSRWLRQMNPANIKRRSRRRTTFYVIGMIIGMIILMMILFGRNNNSSDEDDTFNLHANPHVLVGEGKVPLGHEFDP